MPEETFLVQKTTWATEELLEGTQNFYERKSVPLDFNKGDLNMNKGGLMVAAIEEEKEDNPFQGRKSYVPPGRR